MSKCVCMGILLFTVMATAGTVAAQTSPPATTQSQGRWDEVSDRVVFLTQALATVETSLSAINQQIRVTGYKASAKVDEARLHQRGNELMDRNLGMPATIDWKQFYGRTAQRFFFHPADGIYTNNVRSLADRPPQFDYIYKANEMTKKQALADAAALGGKVQALLQRRGELEGKQTALWMQIPFESVAYQEVTEKPLYLYELKAGDKDVLSQQKLTAVKAGARYVREICELIDQSKDSVSRNQTSALQKLNADTAAASKELEAALVQQTQLAKELSTADRPLQQLAAAAKRSAALARNAFDANDLAAESGAAGDEQSKAQFRAVIGNSLLDYATMVMVADQNLERMSTDWNITPDPAHPVSSTNSVTSAAGTSAPPTSAASTQPQILVDAAKLLPGLQGEYFQDIHWVQLVTQRIDPDIHFLWHTGTSPAPGVHTPVYAVRWTGVIVIPPGGVDAIGVQADDGARLRIDDHVEVDFHSPAKRFRRALLPAGPHKLELEFWNKAMMGVADLMWELPGKPESIVPAEALFHQSQPVSAPASGQP